MAVIFHHIELFKNREKVWSLYDTRLGTFIGTLGKNGVYLFFVLSGFLITYLLLQEINSAGKIDTVKFYIRRILRIWPLYYLIVFICFFVLPYAVSKSGLFGDNYYVRLIGQLENQYTLKLILFSYGIYMFHPLAMFVSYTIALAFFRHDQFLKFNLAFYIGTVTLMILISFLSYRYFEAIFIKLKGRFEVIKSGKE